MYKNLMYKRPTKKERFSWKWLYEQKVSSEDLQNIQQQILSSSDRLKKNIFFFVVEDQSYPISTVNTKT